MKLQTKKIFVATTILGVAAATIVAFSNGRFINRLNARDLTDFDVTLEINPSNVTTGDGSVTLNGNEFSYEGFTVVAGAITLSTNSTLSYSGESGSSFTSDNFVGGGFTKFELLPTASSSFTFTINGIAHEYTDCASGVLISVNVNSPRFELEVTSGSFTVSKLNMKYSCVAPQASYSVMFVGAGDFLSSGKVDYAASLFAGLNETLDAHVPSISTYTMKVLADASTQGGTRFRDTLNELDHYDAIVLQAGRRSTISSTDVDAAEIAALTSISSLLTAKTDNIFIYAPYGDDNQTIFTDDGSAPYKKTSNKETATHAESSEYYTSFSQRLANVVDGKVIDFAGAYELLYSDLGSKPTTAMEYYVLGCSVYSSLFNRAVPSAGTYINSLDSDLAASIRGYAAQTCVTR